MPALSITSNFMSSVGRIECCHPRNEIEGPCHCIEVSARKRRRKMGRDKKYLKTLKIYTFHSHCARHQMVSSC